MVSVSVAMATYNGERYLGEQLESLAAQQHLPSELVITDDVSADSTLAIAQEFAKKAPFVVAVHRNDERLGFRGNFMKAAKLCSSELIAFCDQDDVWLPRKLARCIEPFKDPDVLLAYHSATVVTEAGQPIGNLDHFASLSISPPLSRYPIKWMQYALGFTEVFRRTILDLSDLWELSSDYADLTAPMGHDQWVFFIASVFGKIAYIDERLVSYRQHATNFVGWAGGPMRYNLPHLLVSVARELPALQQVAERCAEMLDQATENLAGPWRRQASTGAAQYRRLAKVYSARKQLYTSPALADRVKSFYSIMSAGGYRPKQIGGLGRKALAPFRPDAC
jgi:glycosyltransferase involved in cell wall biosynthesis